MSLYLGLQSSCESPCPRARGLSGALPLLPQPEGSGSRSFCDLPRDLLHSICTCVRFLGDVPASPHHAYTAAGSGLSWPAPSPSRTNQLLALLARAYARPQIIFPVTRYDLAARGGECYRSLRDRGYREIEKDGVGFMICYQPGNAYKAPPKLFPKIAHQTAVRRVRTLYTCVEPFEDASARISAHLLPGSIGR